MVDHDVQYGTAKVDDRRELILQVIEAMVDLEEACGHLRGPLTLLQHVPAACGHDVMSVRSQKRDVLDDDLSAHANGLRERAARNRLGRDSKLGDDGGPALGAAHASGPRHRPASSGA